MAKLSAIRGFRDYLGEDLAVMERIESFSRDTLETACFDPIRLPLVEYAEVFLRSVGNSSDIVQKEMYTFEDTQGRRLTLRPEGTAGFIRAYLEHGLFKERPVCRFFYAGPMFRHERPQKGRLRQFHQVGAEAMGVADPFLDAEMIVLAARILRGLGVNGFEVHVNSIGCRECREAFRSELVSFLKENFGSLCQDCKIRAQMNPLRVIDCKNCREVTESAPSLLDRLCPACTRDFSKVIEGLRAFAEPFRVNKRIVRGLDYYNRTTFEIYPPDEGGAQSVLVAGGRYDDLVETMGGPSIPGIGFALGVERLASLVFKGSKNPTMESLKSRVAVVSQEESEEGMVCGLLNRLWDARIPAMPVWGPQGLKTKLRFVGKRGFRYALLIPPKADSLILKDMESGLQHEGVFPDIAWIESILQTLQIKG